MSRIISRAESWEAVYTAFQNINFTAFDFDAVKQSLLEYIKLTFPETFNDYIESSEFIAIIESFAYIAELLAYRLDMNAHENFISTAQRRDSVLRLAKLVSYAASRPLPARGLVKISSVSTTEPVIDANGVDLANQTIRWNDSGNSSWKEQFLLVMNRVLEQQFGSVSPFDRFQVQDVLFEMYGVNLIPLPRGVFQYNVTVNGDSLPMELVPITHDDAYGIIERRPENNTNFTLLYGSDGNGDASDTTGFFCFTKQGTLQRFAAEFDGITPNQVYEVNATNINDTDVWVNGVDPTTREILDVPPDFSFRVHDGRSGEWKQVDLAHAQNIIFNTNPNRNKYEVETLIDNKVRLIFGDGEFADIPSGSFDVWTRSSVDEDIIVPQAAAVNVPVSFTYTDSFNRVQTFSFSFTLINSLQNASAAEDLERIRATAPAVYYTQDRMVNGEDYNIYMLQDPSIVKLRAINRTFAGDSKYIPWHDNSQSYENVKIFSDDGFMYMRDQDVTTTTPVVDVNNLIVGYVEPLLSSPDVVLQLVSNGVEYSDIRRSFTAEEKDAITAAMFPPNKLVDMYYEMTTNVWVPIVVRANPTVPMISASSAGLPSGAGEVYVSYPVISIWQPSALREVYDVHRYARRMVIESNTTQFWNTNDANAVIDYDTLNSVLDKIVILQANSNHTRTGILSRNWECNVLGQETDEDTGLQDIHKLVILPVDENGDGVPDNLDPLDASNPQGVAEIFTPKVVVTGNSSGLLPSGTVATSPISTFASDVTLVNAHSGAAVPFTFNGDTNDIGDTITVGVIPATLITSGGSYTITTVGTTDFVAIGASSNTIGVSFTATAVGTGTGTVSINNLVGSTNVTAIIPGITYTIRTVGDTNFMALGATSNTIGVSFVATAVGTGTGTVTSSLIMTVIEYVYFSRISPDSPWIAIPVSYQVLTNYRDDQLLPIEDRLWQRFQGKDRLNFAWFHYSPRYHLVDPSPTNIIDTFIITKGYYIALQRWVSDPTAPTPRAPTALDLRTSYGYLLDNKMISDTVILHPGKIKLLFGAKANPSLRGKFKIIKSQNSILTDNQIKTSVVATISNFFDLAQWEFGETFYFTELAAAIHLSLPSDISSVVLVPELATNQFGDLFQVIAREDEMFYPDVMVDDIDIVVGYTSTNLRQN